MAMQVEPAGPEFDVKSGTGGYQYDPDVVVLADGRIVVVWTDAYSRTTKNGGDGDGNGIFARLYSSSDGELIKEFRVNAKTDGHQGEASITALANGGFALTWAERGWSEERGAFAGISLQIFDQDARSIGDAVSVSAQATGYQKSSGIVALADGRFAVTWIDVQWADGDYRNEIRTVKGQILTATGEKSGGEFTISDEGSVSVWDPNVAALANGGFVVTWDGDRPQDADKSYYARAQLFSSDGEKLGRIFETDSEWKDGAYDTIAVGLSDGSFAVAWVKMLPGGSNGRASELLLQFYDTDGLESGSPVLIAQQTDGYIANIDIAAMAGDKLAVTWMSGYKDATGTWQRLNSAQIVDSTGNMVGKISIPTTNDSEDSALVAAAHGDELTMVSTPRAEAAANGQTGFKAQTYSLGTPNHAPVISSDGGSSAAIIAVKENATFVTKIVAADANADDVLHYAIVGGTDAGLFGIDRDTGELTFLAAPDREMPGDSDGNNVYQVVVAASDGRKQDIQTLSVRVENVEESLVETGTDGDDTITLNGHERYDVRTLGGDDQVVTQAVGTTVLDGGDGYDRWHGQYWNVTESLSFDLRPGATSGAAQLTNVEQIVVNAGSGDDRFATSDAVADVFIDGSAGTDSLTFEAEPVAGDFGLGLGNLSLYRDNGQGGFSGVFGGGAGGRVTFASMENVTATLNDNANDAYVDLDSRILALGAGLTIDARGGSDTLNVNFNDLTNVDFRVDASGGVLSNYGSFSNFETFYLNFGIGSNIAMLAGGNDIVRTMGGQDYVDGGDGYDQWSGYFGEDDSGIVFNLADGRASGRATVTNVEDISVIGSKLDDSFTVDSSVSTVVINANEGRDRLTVDRSAEESGASVNIYAGSDQALSGQIMATGGAGTNLIFTGVEDLDIKLGQGSDYVNLGSTAMQAGAAIAADGGAGTDTLVLGLSGRDNVNFAVSAGGAIESSEGGFANFERFDITLGGGRNTVALGAEDDRIVSTGGAGIYYPGRGDIIDGGAGRDQWVGDYSASVDTNNVYVFSGRASTFAGSAGSSKITNVEDIVAIGGSNDDNFSTDGSIESVRFTGGAGFDTLIVRDGGAADDMTVNSYTTINADGDNGYYGSSNSSGYLSFNGIEQLDVVLNGKNDYVSIRLGSATNTVPLKIAGSDGEDTLSISSEGTNADFDFGAYGEWAYFTGGSASGFETFDLRLGARKNSVLTEGGDDRITSIGGTDTIDGGGGKDSWYGEYSATEARQVVVLASGALSGPASVRNVETINLTLGTGSDTVTADASLDDLYVNGGYGAGRDSLSLNLAAGDKPIAGYGRIDSDTEYGFWGNFQGADSTARFGSMEAVDLRLGDGENNVYVDAKASLAGGTLAITGGRGADTVTVSGLATGYSIALDGTGGYCITDIDASDGDHGTFAVRDVETVQFSDQSVALPRIGGVKTVPTTTRDTATTDEDMAVTIDVLANDRDADGDALTLVSASVADPTKGMVELVNDRLVYRPAANFNGAAELIYTVRDADGNEVQGSVGVIVNAVNDAPTALKLSNNRFAEDTAQWKTLGLFSATDIDGDTLSYSLADADGGPFSMKGARLILNGQFDYETRSGYDLTIGVSDGSTLVYEKVHIDITDVYEAPRNAAPVNLMFGRTSVKENTAIGTSLGQLSAEDPEGGSVSWTMVDDGGGMFALNGRKVKLTGPVDYEKQTTVSFTVRASDSAGNSTLKTFTLDVLDVYEPVAFAAAYDLMLM